MGSDRSPVAFGPYIITRRIARGGMAEIYRARTRSSEAQASRWVALKLMRPSLGHEDLREHLFKREAQIAKMINHPNVIPLLEFGLEMERHYISMEYVRGRDLSHLLKNDKKGLTQVPAEVALYIGYQASLGLGHAHRLHGPEGHHLGIVHRDVSPGNVMVSYDGDVKVLDFGVARVNESEGMRTQTGTLRGKFAYMSPEQTLGENLDARSDVFSMGTVLYELLTGSNCFRADNPIATLERVQRVRPVPPSRAESGVSKSVDRILARCLAKDVSRRFQDGVVLAEALGEYLDKIGFDGRAALAALMRERFAWVKAEEERELQKEEEEVSLLEVVDFALIGEGQGLDAANVAISQEEEASQSEVKNRAVRDRAEDDNVFEPYAGDSEATVAQPQRRFVDDEELGGRSVELSSLLGSSDARRTQEAPAPSPAALARAAVAPARTGEDQPTGRLPLLVVAPPRESLRAAAAPRSTEASSALPPEATAISGPILVGRRAPEFPGTGLLAPAGGPTDIAIRVQELAPSTPRWRTASLISGLVVLTLIVAGVVSLGVEGQPQAETSTPKRRLIAPVTITVDEGRGHVEEAGPEKKSPGAEAAERRPAGRETAEGLAAARAVAEKAAAEKALVEKAKADRALAEKAAAEKAAAVQAAAERAAAEKAAAEKAAAEKAAAEKAAAERAAAEEAARTQALPEGDAREGDGEPRPKRTAPPRDRAPDRAVQMVRLPAKTIPKRAIGYLNVGAKPWAEIAINGKPWPYQTPQAGIELPAGRHTITLSNRELGVSRTQVVTIKQGAYQTISVDLRKK